MVKVGRILFVALVSGLVLGLFLKIIQSTTGILVYILLLNIDFIPFLNQVNWGETGEFLFHLLFSVILTYIYFRLISQSQSVRRYLLLSFMLTVPTIFLYFPLALLAQREVPTVSNVSAIGFWTLGHLLYCVTLAFLSYYVNVKSSAK